MELKNLSTTTLVFRSAVVCFGRHANLPPTAERNRKSIAQGSVRACVAQESQGGAARKVDEGRTKAQFRGSDRWAARDDTMGHPPIRCRRPAVEWEHLPVGQNARPGGGGFPVTYNNKAKLKTLFVKQLLEEETDAEHGLSMKQIINRLEQHGIKAERKNTYRNIEALMEFGCAIQTYQRNPVEYAIVRRDFELDELMLMVDAVQSSKAITIRQANSLVTNIKLLASDHQRAMLDRRIHVPSRIRSKAECVDGNVDVIHETMRHCKKVEFSSTDVTSMGSGTRPVTAGRTS